MLVQWMGIASVIHQTAINAIIAAAVRWWGVSPSAERFLDQLVVWRELGYNMCAIAGNFLTEDLLPQLPEHIQPYVRRVLERRDKIVAGELPAEFGEWRPSFDENGNLLPGILEDENLYTFISHDMFCLAAVDMEVEMGVEAPDQVRVDRRMMEAALAILKLRRDYHFRRPRSCGRTRCSIITASRWAACFWSGMRLTSFAGFAVARKRPNKLPGQVCPSSGS